MIGIIREPIRHVLSSLGYEIKRISRPVEQPPANRETAPEEQIILPEVEANSVLAGRPIQIMEPDCHDGNVSLLELACLNALASRQPASCIFEIGTFDGRTSLNLVANASPAATLHTLDLPPQNLDKTNFALDELDRRYVEKQASGLRFAHTPFSRQIVQLWGDSATFDFTPYEAKCDFIFIDGSHAYDYVKNDTLKALRILKKPGIICWHDYVPMWGGVVRCLNEFYSSGGEFSGLRKVKNTTLAFLEL